MDAFATVSDLGTRMKRTFTVDEVAWVTVLLEDAADFLRGVMRNQVYPSTQSTYTAYPLSGWVNLPQSFIRSIDAVTRNGVPVSWTQHQDSIQVDCDDPVDVTFTYGLSVPPSDLVGFNCVLVSQMMLTVEAGLGLTAGGLSSVAIDDYKAAFADGGAGTGLTLTDASTKYLTERYGRSGWFVGSVK